MPVVLAQLLIILVSFDHFLMISDYLLISGETKGTIRLPGMMMLGYVAAHSETLAMAVIMSKGKVIDTFRTVGWR